MACSNGEKDGDAKFLERLRGRAERCRQQTGMQINGGKGIGSPGRTQLREGFGETGLGPTPRATNRVDFRQNGYAVELQFSKPRQHVDPTQAIAFSKSRIIDREFPRVAPGFTRWAQAKRPSVSCVVRSPFSNPALNAMIGIRGWNPSTHGPHRT